MGNDLSKYWGSISFTKMMDLYITMQEKAVKLMQSLAGKACIIAPGKFIFLQFAMSQVAQVGQSVSNVVSTITTVISNAVRNVKVQ